MHCKNEIITLHISHIPYIFVSQPRAKYYIYYILEVPYLDDHSCHLFQSFCSVRTLSNTQQAHTTSLRRVLGGLCFHANPHGGSPSAAPARAKRARVRAIFPQEKYCGLLIRLLISIFLFAVTCTNVDIRALVCNTYIDNITSRSALNRVYSNFTPAVHYSIVLSLTTTNGNPCAESCQWHITFCCNKFPSRPPLFLSTTIMRVYSIQCIYIEKENRREK